MYRGIFTNKWIISGFCSLIVFNIACDSRFRNDSNPFQNDNPKRVAVAQEKDADVPVSPHGFGPYPEIPEGFGPVRWTPRTVDGELWLRVKIKLYTQGVDVQGMVGNTVDILTKLKLW